MIIWSNKKEADMKKILLLLVFFVLAIGVINAQVNKEVKESITEKDVSRQSNRK